MIQQVKRPKRRSSLEVFMDRVVEQFWAFETSPVPPAMIFASLAATTEYVVIRQNLSEQHARRLVSQIRSLGLPAPTMARTDLVWRPEKWDWYQDDLLHVIGAVSAHLSATASQLQREEQRRKRAHFVTLDDLMADIQSILDRNSGVIALEHGLDALSATRHLIQTRYRGLRVHHLTVELGKRFDDKAIGPHVTDGVEHFTSILAGVIAGIRQSSRNHTGTMVGVD